MIKFLLIRHAMTDLAGKCLAGRSPGIHLNEEGRLQAIELANRLAGASIAAIYSSPLERALETAQPLAKLHNLPCNISEDFNEVDFGKWTNHFVEELACDPKFKLFNFFRSGIRIPGGEYMPEVQSRVLNGLKKLHDLHKNQTVAIISHADTIKAAIAHFAGIPLDMIDCIEVSPASISVIEVFEETGRILSINNIVNMERALCD